MSNFKTPLIMEEVKKLIEKGIGRIAAIIVYWDHLSQEEKEVLDFKTLSEAWKSPSMNGKNEVWELLQKKAKSFNDHVFILEETFGNKLVFFDILKKKAKTFNQRVWVFNHIDYYSKEKTGVEKKEIWNDLKKRAKTLRLLVDLWMIANDKPDEREAFLMIKEKTKNIADCKFLLDNCFSSKREEWKEIYLIAKEKAESLEDYLFIYEKESDAENIRSLWKIVKSKAETLEQRAILFEMANDERSEECLNFARLKL